MSRFSYLVGRFSGVHRWPVLGVPRGHTANKCNCVYSVRCLVPSYPSPATYYSQKVKSINASWPAVGSVAIIRINPPYGHVAEINNMWWNWTDYIANLNVPLSEANYRARQGTTTRRGTPANLQIVGYYLPWIRARPSLSAEPGSTRARPPYSLLGVDSNEPFKHANQYQACTASPPPFSKSPALSATSR
jgi:hypothetical protein